MRAGHARSAAADQTRSCRRFTPATLPGVRGLPTSAFARSDDTDRAFVRRPIDRDWRGRKHRCTDDGCSYQDRFAPGRSPSKEYEVNNRRSAIQVTRSDRQFDLKQRRPMVAFWKFTVTETEVPERFPYPGLVRCDLFRGGHVHDLAVARKRRSTSKVAPMSPSRAGQTIPDYEDRISSKDSGARCNAARYLTAVEIVVRVA